MAETASKSDQAIQVVKLGFIVIGGYYGLTAITKVAEGLGLKKTAEEQATDKIINEDANLDATKIQDQNNPYVAFNPNYSNAIVTAWKKKYPGLVWNIPRQEHFPRQQYIDWAKDIYEAKKSWIINPLSILNPAATTIPNDNEDILYYVFRGLQTQFQISLLSRIFSYTYKVDLLLYLKSFLNAEELNKILQIIRYYPQYYK